MRIHFKTPSLQHFLMPGLTFRPDVPTSSPRGTQEDVQWVLQSVHNSFPLPPLPPHALSLLRCGVPSVGDCPSPTSPTRVLSMGCSSSQTATAWIPRGATDLARSLLHDGISTGSQLPSGHIHLLWHGFLHGLQVDVCPTLNLHGLQGDKLHHQLIRDNLCHEPHMNLEHLIPSSFFADFSACRVVSLPYSHSSLPHALVHQFFNLLKCIIVEVPPPSLTGPALVSGRSVL